MSMLAVPGILGGERRPVVLALTPIAIAIAANLAGQYPLCEARLTSFLFPGVLLLHGQGWNFGVPRWMGHGALAMALTAGLWAGFQPSRWPVRQRGDVQQGVAHLSAHMDRQADVLFVHGAAQEEYRFYAGLAGFAPADIVIGQTGVGCCPRHLDAYRAYNDDQFLRDEFNQVLARGTARRIWFLHIRQGTFGEPRQEEPLHRAMLEAKGCRREQGFQLGTTLVSSYRCPL